MISFHEMELNFTPKPYKIILSRLIVNGREISVGDKTGILQHSLCHTGEITLNADQSMFSIEFATSNYIPVQKTNSLSTFITYTYFTSEKAGYASAIGIFQFVFIFAVSFFINRYFAKKEVQY